MTESDAQSEERLRAFFDERLVPAARALRRRGVRFFPSGPDDGQSSWYLDYPPDTPELVELDAADARAQLERLWSAEGHPELVALAGPLADLADQLDARAVEQTDDISPFIYVMF